MARRIPAIVNLWAHKGRSFYKTYQMRNNDGDAVDLSLFTIESKVNEYADGSGATIATFTVTKNSIEGTFTIALDEIETAGVVHNTGYYDVKITNPDGISRSYFKGAVYFNESRTP